MSLRIRYGSMLRKGNAQAYRGEESYVRPPEAYGGGEAS